MTTAAEQWWVVNADELRAALHRAHNGTDPEVVFIELYANTTTEEHE